MPVPRFPLRFLFTPRAVLACLLALASLGCRAGEAAATVSSQSLPSGASVASQRYPAAGGPLVLWFTGQHGAVEAEARAAARLAELGAETWLTDWFAPYFLPQLPSSVAAVPDADLADWLEGVRRDHPERRIVLLAVGHAAAWPARAVRAWRERHAAQGRTEPVAGGVLLFPILYRDSEPGAEPVYDPVVTGTRLDTVLLQPTSSAGYWWRDRLKAALESAGGLVRLEALPGVRDGFYRRPDATAREQAEGARLGDILFQAMQPLLEAPRP